MTRNWIDDLLAGAIAILLATAAYILIQMFGGGR